MEIEEEILRGKKKWKVGVGEQWHFF